jgi:hypothetical protein
VGGVAAVAICRDSWRSVLVGLWWWTGGNRGVVEETRAAMGRALADKEAWAFATAHKEVIGRVKAPPTEVGGFRFFLA